MVPYDELPLIFNRQLSLSEHHSKKAELSMLALTTVIIGVVLGGSNMSPTNAAYIHQCDCPITRDTQNPMLRARSLTKCRVPGLGIEPRGMACKAAGLNTKHYLLSTYKVKKVT